MKKIVVKRPCSKDFYEELMCIALKINKFKKKPNKKTNSLIKEYSILLYLTVFAEGCLFAAYILNDDVFSLCIGCVGLFSFLIYFRFLLSIRKQIKNYLSERGKVEIDLGKKKILFDDGVKTISLNVDNIKHILINKHSICFISEYIQDVIIAIPVKYANDVLEYAESMKLTDKVYDNRKSY